MTYHARWGKQDTSTRRDHYVHAVCGKDVWGHWGQTHSDWAHNAAKIAEWRRAGTLCSHCNWELAQKGY